MRWAVRAELHTFECVCEEAIRLNTNEMSEHVASNMGLCARSLCCQRAHCLRLMPLLLRARLRLWPRLRPRLRLRWLLRLLLRQLIQVTPGGLGALAYSLLPLLAGHLGCGYTVTAMARGEPKADAGSEEGDGDC